VERETGFEPATFCLGTAERVRRTLRKPNGRAPPGWEPAPIGLGDGVTEVTLDTLDDALDGILAGRARGRWLVRIGS
jgi:hypothetical protein